MNPGRYLFLTIGVLAVVLGLVGVVLPIMPGLPFFVLALWAFARGDQRIHNWFAGHPLFGRPLANWRRHQVIPRFAKCAMLIGLAGGAAAAAVLIPYNPALAAQDWLQPVTGPGWILPSFIGTINFMIGAYVLSRPSRAPELFVQA